MSDSRPIGVFDSGIGGLTVLKALAHNFPDESFLYLGDTARLPYGSKSSDTIYRYSEQNARFLLSKNVKAVVIACNSASSHFPLREMQAIPIYNVIEPGAQMAIASTVTKKIGVLGTRATVASGSYAKALKKLDAAVEIFQQACPLFVPLAEEGWDEDPITNLIAYRYIQPLLNSGIDTFILGCTHYPILRHSISRVTGSHAALVDSGEALSQMIKADMKRELLRRNAHGKQVLRIMTTDGSSHFTNLAQKILFPALADEFSVVNV
ncbi:MAG: glutamate racemase [Pseudobdellovibrionaceae bacterium]